MAKKKTRGAIAALCLLLSTLPASATPDLFIRDTPADTGLEPNPDTGPMWISEDIWVRNYPDPNFSPYPFPTASPPWTPAPHQDPEWRDPKYGNPNYVYVRVTNRGTTTSTGVEWLKLYWAKASTGLSWPTQWVDYLASNCGPTKLYGIEITKERKNAATATAAERDLYRDAILAAATNFFTGDPVSFWHKQNVIHANTPTVAPTFAIHASLVFNSWHREFINRYEVLLQEAKPTVKLLYWDWTTDPGSTTGFNFFTPTFMGASGRGTGGVSIGAPFLPALAPPPVTRQLSSSTTPPANPDATVIAATPYPTFRSTLELSPNHNASHGYIGGSGTMSFTNTASSDPFFFLLHGNVDRLWAMWQRNPAALSRLDPNLTYAPQSANVLINSNMAPWNGDTGIFPYTVAGGYIFNKTSKHPSVVFPPIYDTARLKVPALAPGESVILEIPWYPPNPADYACFSDSGHVCLLARVVNSDSAPYGMTFAEGAGVGTNTKNNNNIAWKNVTVVDNFPGSALRGSILVRNVWDTRVKTRIRLAAVPEEDGTTFFDFGKVALELHPELLERWLAAGAKGDGVQVVQNDRGERLVLVDREATLDDIELPERAAYYVNVRFDLDPKYPAPKGARPRWDLYQVGTPEDPEEVVGGERFVLDFNQLTLSPQGAVWSYTDRDPGKDWQLASYDASWWKKGKAEIGFGDDPATVLTTPSPDAAGAVYFRRSFTIDDPGLYHDLLLRLKADDGAVVYLNGKEVHRKNLGPGGVDYPTPASAEVAGIEEDTFVETPIPTDALVAGQNLIAVEVHQNKDAAAPDLSFDLELAANVDGAPTVPSVGFASYLAGGQFQQGDAIPVRLDAFGSHGRQLDFELEIDGKKVAKGKDAPFTYTFSGAKAGPHRLKVTAIDPSGGRSESFATVNVLANLPPQVRISQPADLALLPEAASYTFTAEAADPGGAIDRVEFFIKDGMTFAGPVDPLGVAKTPPYTITTGPIPAGHWMIMAIAYDNKGESTDAAPIHIEVGRASSHH